LNKSILPASGACPCQGEQSLCLGDEAPFQRIVNHSRIAKADAVSHRPPTAAHAYLIDKLICTLDIGMFNE
jgi:hypothetical protein